MQKNAVLNDLRVANKTVGQYPTIILLECELKKLQSQLELYQIFDKNHKKLFVASRKAVVNLNLICEAAHIYIFNRRGEMLLQKRAANKDTYPNLYSSSAAGRVNFGETVEEAARRELLEELGLKTKLARLGTIKCFTKLSSEFDHVFVGVTSNKPKPNDEIKSLNYFKQSEIDRLDSKSAVPAMPLELKKFLPKMRRLIHSRKL